MLKVGMLLIRINMVVLAISTMTPLIKNDARATLRLKIVDPNGDHSIYTMTFNRADKTVQLIDVATYNPQGYMIGSETLANTKVQIQDGSNLDHVYHLIW